MAEKSSQPREARRRAAARATRAHAVQREQEAVDEGRRAWEKRRRRRFTAYGLMVLGLLIAGSHVLEHAGAYQLLPNPTMSDIFLGYPTGGVLLIIGLAMLPAQSH